MTLEPITVAIPVGPSPANQQWLPEAIESCKAQTHPPAEILLIDDMAGIERCDCRVWKAPWLLGVGAAFNMGVALAKTELVFMLGSDDTLDPKCLEQCAKTYEKNDRADAYYWTSLHYMDGEDQTLPCNAAMVTKGFWRKTGGFPPETGSGAPDAALISMLMTKMPGSLVGVSHGHPLYNYRRHQGTDTASRGPWQSVILSTRDILSATWQEPNWGRYE